LHIFLFSYQLIEKIWLCQKLKSCFVFEYQL